MQILEALPTIHGILIGIGTAFFSGFAMFAYQKLQESKDNLDKVLSEVESFSTPNTHIGGVNFISEDGALDWDGAGKELLHHSKSIFSHLDYEEKYGIPRHISDTAPSESDICSTTRSLCSLFSQLFVSYPFSGKSMVHVSGITDRVESKKSAPFTVERLKEIQRRIGYLSWCWQTSNRSLITLAERCTEIEGKQAEIESRQRFTEQISQMGNEIDEKEKKRIWDTFHQPSLNMKINYAQILTEYFNKVGVYQERVIPQLSETLVNHQTFVERFNFKENTLAAFKIIAFIFVFGVLTPIILVGLKTDMKLVWHPVLPYSLIVLTVLPYAYVWRKLFQKVKSIGFG